MVKNQNVEIFLNGGLIHSAKYEKPVGNLYGINFKFMGAGAVDYVRLRNGKEEVIYEDEFDGRNVENNNL